MPQTAKGKATGPPADRSLDAQKLLYFAAIVEHGSLGKAAKALGLTQPALSVAMDRLESALGKELLVRTPSGVELTETGELLVRHARCILESVSAIERQFFGEGDASKGVLRFGCIPTLAGSVVPLAIRHWRVNHPELELEVTERPQNELLWGLLERDLDFSVGVVDQNNTVYGLKQRVLFRERLCVVARPEHVLARRESQTLDDLTSYPWVSPTTGWRNTALEQVLEPSGLSLKHKVTVCSSISLLKSLVAESDHLALLPAHAVQEELTNKRLTLLSFDQKNLERSIAVFLREGVKLEQPSLDLLQLIQEQGRQRYAVEGKSEQMDIHERG